MGIVNVTPDSFSDGGTHNEHDAAVAFAEQLLADGADIIDVGGESTRPGSAAPTIDEEIARVVPVVRTLAARGVCVSVDTRHAKVAAESLAAGAAIINDVAGMRDAAMREVVAASNCGIVVMHMLGEPGTMQDAPRYDDCVAEVEDYVLQAAHQLEALGVAPERICLDPGIGFGKSFEHNRALLEATPRFAALGYPFMVAVSRKSHIGACSGITEPLRRDEASALCAAAALAEGAQAARVHNAAATRSAIEHARRAVVAFGSNMGDGAGTIEGAIAALRRVPGVWVTRVSSIYESEPAYYEEQPTFTNAVALVHTTLAPAKLLDALHGVENEFGRVRSMPNGPRTLDLDIIDYESVTSSDAALSLPHPLALERDFVVTPLLEVTPGYVLANGTPVTRDAITCGNVVSPSFGAEH